MLSSAGVSLGLRHSRKPCFSPGLSRRLRIRRILLLLLLRKLFQFSGELLDSLINGKLSVNGRDQKIADRLKSGTTDTKDWKRWFKIDVLGRLRTVLVVSPTFPTRRWNRLFFARNRPPRRLNKGTLGQKSL